MPVTLGKGQGIGEGVTLTAASYAVFGWVGGGWGGGRGVTKVLEKVIRRKRI